MLKYKSIKANKFPNIQSKYDVVIDLQENNDLLENEKQKDVIQAENKKRKEIMNLYNVDNKKKKHTTQLKGKGFKAEEVFS